MSVASSRYGVVATLLVLLASWSAPAAEMKAGGVRTAILLPLAFTPSVASPGASGTIWSGEVWIENRTTQPIELVPCPAGYLCPGIPAGGARLLGPPLGEHPELGHLLFIPDARNFTFSNRIYERTMRGQPRGVEIPVVRESEFFTGEQTFLGVPVDSGVRVSLRVYDPWINVSALRSEPALERVEVEVRGQQGLLATTTLRPRVLNPTTPSEDHSKPGFAAVYDLAADLPEVAGQVRVHVRVRPVPAGAQYWGMIAVTDNETQTVSIITAQ